VLFSRTAPEKSTVFRAAMRHDPDDGAALVSVDLFELAVRKLRLNRERSPRRTRYHYLLQGLLA
jgi:hypothetical protein